MKPFNERIWMTWQTQYKTFNQPVNIYFKPLYEIYDETYKMFAGKPKSFSNRLA